MKLVDVNKKYKEIFQEAVKDYYEYEDWKYYYRYEEAIINFEKFVDDFKGYEKGVGITEDQVPFKTMWLVDDEESEIRGIVRIRHVKPDSNGHIGYDIPPKKRLIGYGGVAFSLAVKEARKLGVEDIIVTCAVENESSRKIILRNGGNHIKTSEKEDGNYDEFVIKK